MKRQTLTGRIKNADKYTLCFLLIMLMGVLIRFVSRGVPEGINADEAYSAYEAYSLLHYSIDSHGYHNPLYFISLGSGRNVLESYAMMPFIALFGLTRFAVRLPQRLGGVATLFFFYLILKKTGNRKFALLGLFLLAVNPWHITMSRWALESNFVIVFLAGGLYFFLRGLERERFFLASALFFGLSLYCYALVWIFVPLFLLLAVLYCVRLRKIRFSLWAVLSLLLLFFMALPLILFLFINAGLLPEIRTPLFSIPSLSGVRTSEFALSNLLVPIRNLYRFLVSQDDGLIFSSVPGFGYYYLFSLPFILAGLVVIFEKTVSSVKNREFSVHVFFFFSLLCAVAVGLSQLEINANRLNVIHLPVIYCCAVGVYTACMLFRRVVPQTILAAYALSFVAFGATYFTSYAKDMAEAFGWEESRIINTAVEMAGTDRTIRTDPSFEPLKVLYYTKYPAPDFAATVYYPNEPSPWLIIDSFGPFVFHIDYDALDPEAVYIITHEDIPLFEKEGYIIDRFYTYALAHRKTP